MWIESEAEDLYEVGKFGTLAKAIEDFEDFFLTEKKGELYRFLMLAVEKPLLESVLQRNEGNQLKTAKILGINRNTLHAKIKKLKINVEDFKKGGIVL